MNQKFELSDDPQKDAETSANTPVGLAYNLPASRPQPHVERPLPKRVVRKSITTLTLTSSTCKWPFGDPTSSDFHYCGQPPQVGRPYCDTHDRMSYQSSQRKVRS
jgi:GcrA cell cycle regulator